MSTKATKLNAERAAYQSDCVTQALINGTKAAGWALATAGLLVSAANSLSPTFQRALGVSGKAGLIVSPAFFMYFLEAEQTMSRCAKDKTWNAARDQSHTA